MRSLPIAVLFSLVSLVAAFSKRGHSIRHAHARSRCHSSIGGIYNQTDIKQNQTATDGNQNHTATDGNQNHTATDGNQNHNVTGGGLYKLVDQYKGQDFLDEA